LNVHRLVKHPHPALREHAQPVIPDDPTLPGLVADMQQVLRESVNGVGLAANQVGVLKRVIVLRDYPFAAANPAYTAAAKAWRMAGSEGCLSDPGSEYMVVRVFPIVATWDDLQTGERKSKRLTGLPARVWQHECDHLNGINIRDIGTKK
jgi:peptide deformylase